MELPNDPDGNGPLTGTRYPMFDWGNVNHTGAGTMAFGGDYIGVKEVAAPGASPTFMVAFSDNRYNIWPWQTERAATSGGRGVGSTTRSSWLPTIRRTVPGCPA